MKNGTSCAGGGCGRHAMRCIVRRGEVRGERGVTSTTLPSCRTRYFSLASGRALDCFRPSISLLSNVLARGRVRVLFRKPKQTVIVAQ